MPLYRYTAKDLQSKTKKGKLEAVDETALVQALREDGLYLVEAKALPEAEHSIKRLKVNDLSDFCRQIGTMLGSGISLVRAMYILLERDLPKKQRLIYTNVYQLLQQGNTMSEALAAQGKAFPDLMINMFRAGESSGRLDKTAMKLATQFEKDHRLNGKVKSAMMYPAILLVMTIVVMLLLFTMVLPDLFVTLDENGAALPLLTRIIRSISDFLIQYWYIVLIGVLILVAIWLMLLRNPKVRLALDKFKLRLPKFKHLLSIIYTARFARTLCSLYSSGLSMISSLRISADVIGNTYLAGQFDEVVAHVRNGEPLSQVIRRVKGFDPKLASSVFIGEETGQLDSMLETMADDFDFESEMATQKLVTILEPIMILVMAVLIGGVMLSVLTPIWGLYNNIQ